MLEFPRGAWKWLADNGRDLARIAAALETITAEATEVRKALQEADQKEQHDE